MARLTSSRRRHSKLQVVHPDVAAIDIGARFHVVAIPPDRDLEPVRRFDSFTHDLQRLAGLLVQQGITTVAMESTGIYWIPVFEIQKERGLEVILANAREVKNVPSGAYRLEVLTAPSSQGLEPPGIPVRFTRVQPSGRTANYLDRLRVSN